MYCTSVSNLSLRAGKIKVRKVRLRLQPKKLGSATLVNDLIIFVLYLLFHSSVDTRGPPTVTARLSAKVTIAVIVVVVFRVSL